jgi:hypothetical protein
LLTQNHLSSTWGWSGAGFAAVVAAGSALALAPLAVGFVGEGARAESSQPAQRPSHNVSTIEVLR